MPNIDDPVVFTPASRRDRAAELVNRILAEEDVLGLSPGVVAVGLESAANALEVLTRLAGPFVPPERAALHELSAAARRVIGEAEALAHHIGEPHMDALRRALLDLSKVLG